MIGLTMRSFTWNRFPIKKFWLIPCFFHLWSEVSCLQQFSDLSLLRSRKNRKGPSATKYWALSVSFYQEHVFLPQPVVFDLELFSLKEFLNGGKNFSTNDCLHFLIFLLPQGLMFLALLKLFLILVWVPAARCWRVLCSEVIR